MLCLLWYTPLWSNSSRLKTPGPGFLTEKHGSCVDTRNTPLTDPCDSFNLKIILKPSFKLNCNITNVTLDAILTVPLQYVVLQWSGPGISNSNQHILQPNVMLPGIYTLMATDTVLGCSDEVVTYVEQDITPPITAAGVDMTLTCTIDTLVLDGALSQVGPNITYFWEGPAILPGQNHVPSPLINGPGIYSLKVSNLDNGCNNTDFVIVHENITPPIADAGLDQNMDCAHATVTLDGSGSFANGQLLQYFWEGPGILAAQQQNERPLVGAPGLYTLIVTNPINGCKDTSSVQVFQQQTALLNADIALKNVSCHGEKDGIITVLHVNGGVAPFQYYLNNGPGGTNATFHSLLSADYALKIIDASGCVLDTLLTITQPDPVSVDLGDDITVQLGETASINALIIADAGLESVIWLDSTYCQSSSPFCTEFTYLPLKSTRHEIYIVDKNGCTASDQLTINVTRKIPFYLPNAFSPEATDSNNQRLMFQGNSGIAEVERWLIFDRWGNRVFEIKNFQPDDPAYAWDGRINGKLGPSAVYTWMAQIRWIDGTVEIFKGAFTLIR